MNNNITSRRGFLQCAVSTTLLAGISSPNGVQNQSRRKDLAWEPKISENLYDLTESSLRWMAQLGHKHVVLMTSRGIDRDNKGFWSTEDIKIVQEKCKIYGMELASMFLHPELYPNACLGKPGRDEEIERVIKSINAAGNSGISNIEWFFWPDFFWDERVGYSTIQGRGGAGYRHFDYDKVNGQPPFEKIGVISKEEMWEYLLYFAKPIVEAAEKSGIKLACHPNDPPVPNMRGVARILISPEAFERLFNEIPSPSNGMVFCQGVFTELGENIPDTIRRFKNRIHHVHIRAVRGTVPKYTEVFIDEGDVDMLEAMKTYKEIGYTRTMVSDHTPRVENDTGFGYIGRSFSHGYIRAMVQVVNALP